MKMKEGWIWTLRILSICIIITASFGMFYLAKSVSGYFIAIVVTLDLMYAWNSLFFKK